MGVMETALDNPREATMRVGGRERGKEKEEKEAGKESNVTNIICEEVQLTKSSH